MQLGQENCERKKEAIKPRKLDWVITSYGAFEKYGEPEMRDATKVLLRVWPNHMEQTMGPPIDETVASKKTEEIIHHPPESTRKELNTIRLTENKQRQGKTGIFRRHTKEYE